MKFPRSFLKIMIWETRVDICIWPKSTQKKSEKGEYPFYTITDIIRSNLKLNDISVARDRLHEFVPQYRDVMNNSYWKDNYRDSTRRQLAGAYALVGDLDEAKRIISAEIKDNNKKKWAYQDVAICLSDSGHFKEAIDVLETKGSENKEYTYKNISKNMAIQSSIADSYNWAIKESIASHSCYIFFGIMDYMYSDI